MSNAPTKPLDPTPKAAAAGRWLAIETAGLHGSIAIAVAERDRLVVEAEHALRTDTRSAQSLAPAIAELLNETDWRPADLAAIAVAVGPGSFTGLRVGVVTAKTLAYALGVPIVGADTLDALAADAEAPASASGRLWSVLDAQRREVFTASFVADGAAWRRDSPTRRLSRDELVATLVPGDRVIGPIAATLDVPEGVEAIAANPRAAAVLRVAHDRWLAGEADSVLALAPAYHRLSAAEEKAGESSGTPRRGGTGVSPE